MLAAMSTREVRFCVTCADTRLGQHVRVVGSSKTLGEWSSQAAAALTTSAADFPLWRSTGLIPIDENSLIEYKYVICDVRGKAIRWEERPNRSLHLNLLAGRGVCPPSGRSCSVVEGFNGTDPPDDPKRFCPLEATRGLVREGSMTRVRSIDLVKEHAAAQTEGTDMFEPTVRERCPSMSREMSEQERFSRIRSSSLSIFGSLGHLPGDPNPTLEVAASQDSQEINVEGDASAAPPLTLFREESCSNLFLFEPGDDEVEEQVGQQEFSQKYSLVGEGPLGEGTFGLVWRCSPKASNGNVERAAKIVKKARLQARDMRYLLGEDGEISTHITMKHPNIVELFEYFDEPQSVTLVLEFCKGGDLFDAILTETRRTNRAFTEEAGAVATQHVLSALAYIHGHQVCHRDVKCENVLLAYQGVPVEKNLFKLCDFGFAAHDRGEGFTDRLGSPDTVAPEVVVGKRYSFPADLWSAGTLVYMMLSATPPFYATSDQDVLRKVRQGLYSLAGPIWDTISDPPKHVIKSLMTVDIDLRPTAQETLGKAWLKDLPPIRGKSSA